MTDLNSYGVRSEATRKWQARVERNKPLRVLVSMVARLRGPKPLIYKHNGDTRGPMGRLGAMVQAHPALARAPGKPNAEEGAKLMPSTIAYRAYHAGLITARQARQLGATLRVGGRKPGAGKRTRRGRA